MSPPKRGRVGGAALLTLALALPWATALDGQIAAVPRDRAEPAPAPAAPDALVLSTGSSRGLVHAGAMLGLERRGYDPDLVVGSSMGAVMGSLYAAGYSAEQIWDIVLATSWGDLFMASPVIALPDRQLLFPGITLGLDLGTLEVSSGFIPDWRVNRFLSHLLFDASARARSDFDRLPRRYRSVATDLATGEEVVLAAGDLARAVRASMGTPAFFAATPWRDRLLGDGGIANYLPVSVARRLGAGRVVAVDVSRAPTEVRRTDPTALGGRSISLLMRNALRDTVPPDVLLRPELDPDFPGAVFPEQPRFLMDLGLDAALAATIEPTAAPRARVAAAPPAALSSVELEGVDPTLASLVERAFSSAVGPYRPGAVLRAMDHLYDTGLFSGVWPRVEQRGADSADVLVVAVDARPRMALNGAAGYENDRGGRLWAVLDSRHPFLGAPLEVRVGGGNDGVERWAEGSLLLHSSRLAGLAWNAGVHHRRIKTLFFEGRTGDEFLPVHRIGGWAGARFRRDDVIASLVGQAERLDVEDGVEGPSWGAALRISSALAPTLMVGMPPELLLKARFGVTDYQTLSGRYALHRGLGPVHVAALADGAVALGDPPPDELPALGDRHAMPGLAWGEGRGHARLLGGLDVAWPAVGSGWGRLRLRGGAAPDVADDLRALDGWIAGAALEGVWTTPFGPVQVGYGVNTRGGHRFDVGIGGAF